MDYALNMHDQNQQSNLNIKNKNTERVRSKLKAA
jgi:hypothetical protein